MVVGTQGSAHCNYSFNESSIFWELIGPLIWSLTVVVDNTWLKALISFVYFFQCVVDGIAIIFYLMN